MQNPTTLVEFTARRRRGDTRTDRYKDNGSHQDVHEELITAISWIFPALPSNHQFHLSTIAGAGLLHGYRCRTRASTQAAFGGDNSAQVDSTSIDDKLRPATKRHIAGYCYLDPLPETRALIFG